MDNIFFGNINIIANSTTWFCEVLGIDTPDFSEAITASTIKKIYEYYENNGIDFSMETMEISKDAMLYVYDHIMRIANLARVAASLGLTPDDFEPGDFE